MKQPNPALQAAAARRAVDLFVEFEQHCCRLSPALAALPELGRSAPGNPCLVRRNAAPDPFLGFLDTTQRP
jgi:hypothetical protein